MATLKEYYEKDFHNTLRLHLKLPFNNTVIQCCLLYDFIAYSSFFACYVEEKNKDLEYFLQLIKSLKHGLTQLQVDNLITLPRLKDYEGGIRVANKGDIIIEARLLGEARWVNAKNIPTTGRIYIFSESDLTDQEIEKLYIEAEKNNHKLLFRSKKYAVERMKVEKPLAFISHDSRDKKDIATKIAFNLQKWMCPVWYDEFSLKVGDNLRLSIEKGLKECKKCILILSPNFIHNNGWTRTEFDSIFTRQILEEQNLVLPVWVNVTKQEVYDYSPSLLNIKGLNWNELGEEEVCRSLHKVIE